MSFFTLPQKTIDLDGENTVTIRKLTYGQQQAAISVSGRIDPVAKIANVDYGLLKQEEMIASIVGWSGPGFEGREPTRANILALPRDIGELISQAVDEINAFASDSEKKASGESMN